MHGTIKCSYCNTAMINTLVKIVEKSTELVLCMYKQRIVFPYVNILNCFNYTRLIQS